LVLVFIAEFAESLMLSCRVIVVVGHPTVVEAASVTKEVDLDYVTFSQANGMFDLLREAQGRLTVKDELL
jgi:hypothetical protein